MRVVYITDFYYRTDSGAKTSARAHLQTLQTIYGFDNVRVIALTGKRKPESAEESHIIYANIKSNFALFVQCVLGYTTYIDRNIENNILKDIDEFDCDAVFIDNSFYGKLCKRIRKNFPNIGIITYYHDVKAGLAEEWLKDTIWYKKPVCTAMIHNEKWNQDYCDVNLVLNERENNVFKKFYGKSAEGYLSVYMDIRLNQNEEISASNGPVEILFVGGSYFPNVNGIRWFINEVLPMVKMPCVLNIVGNSMDNVFSDDSLPNNVKVLGHVDKLDSVYMSADMVIAPIFEGAGMKVKTAEAIGYGKVIAASDEALVGYIENIPQKLVGSKIFVANTKLDYVKAINYVYQNRSELKKYNQDIRDIYEEYYSEVYAKRVISAAIGEAIRKRK